MRWTLTLVTCACAAAQGWPEPIEISINGVVKDSASQKALGGAVVRMRASGLADTTDASGAFALVGVPVSVAGNRAASPAGPSLPVLAAGGAIRLDLPTAGRVSIRGLTVDGRQAFHSERLLPAGVQVVGCGGAARGVVMYRVRAGGQEFVLRRAPAGAWRAARRAGDAAGASALALAKAAAGFADTLVVTKPRYVTKLVPVASATVTALAIQVAGEAPGTVTDMDGNVYQTVTIGTQVWITENLRTTKYRDGTAIPMVPDAAAWQALSTPAYCWYQNNEGNKATYGALYNWFVVDPANPRQIAPVGWHVPSDSEWTALTTYLGGQAVAGGKLKSTGTTLWHYFNVGATNETGFTAVPAGYRGYAGNYTVMIFSNYLWSTTADNSTYAASRSLSFDDARMFRGSNDKRDGFSVRCVRD